MVLIVCNSLPLTEVSSGNYECIFRKCLSKWHWENYNEWRAASKGILNPESIQSLSIFTMALSNLSDSKILDDKRFYSCFSCLQVSEVRQMIGTLPDTLSIYCSGASISRYLSARNWNVKKATKMLKDTLKWRAQYKPDEIRWVCYYFILT